MSLPIHVHEWLEDRLWAANRREAFADWMDGGMTGSQPQDMGQHTVLEDYYRRLLDERCGAAFAAQEHPAKDKTDGLHI